MATLSPRSRYEQIFGTRHRRPGRPSGENEKTLFPANNVNPLIARVAQRRAYAIIHEVHKKELHEAYLAEVAVLEKRGVQVVAKDISGKRE